MENVDPTVHIFTATALRRLALRSAVYIHGKAQYSFYRRLGMYHDQSEHEEVKKSPSLSRLGSNPGRPALSQAPGPSRKNKLKIT